MIEKLVFFLSWGAHERLFYLWLCFNFLPPSLKGFPLPLLHICRTDFSLTVVLKLKWRTRGLWWVRKGESAPCWMGKGGHNRQWKAHLFQLETHGGYSDRTYVTHRFSAFFQFWLAKILLMPTRLLSTNLSSCCHWQIHPFLSYYIWMVRRWMAYVFLGSPWKVPSSILITFNFLNVICLLKPFHSMAAYKYITAKKKTQSVFIIVLIRVY